MALGAISLGYGDLDVIEAARDELNFGTVFGLPSPLEEELALELAPLMPWPDPMFRFGKNGSDACAAAVMLARELNGRRRFFSDGYHGWILRDDPRVTIDAWDDDLAAAIVEPDHHHWVASPRAGALLIFDEILTGFRYPGFTYAAYSGVTPDLICLGKAIANGFPLSVVAGPRHLMEQFDRVWYSTTFGGETVSLAAALATVRKFKREPVIERLWEVGRAVQDHWNAEAARVGVDVPCAGDPPRSVIRWPSMAAKTLVCEQMFRRGIMFTVGFTACYAHTADDIARTNKATTAALELLSLHKDNPVAACEGRLISEPLRSHG